MYNEIQNVIEMLSYLEQAAGFTYFQNPVQWQDAFQSIINSSPKLLEYFGGTNVAEITNIAQAYASVGKDIYATAESGLKSAPVIESIFTSPNTEEAATDAQALGTYVAGVAAGIPLATCLAGCLSGLGIGILSYEVAPEAWVDLSNYVFGTDINPEEVQPLLKTYIQGMWAKDSHGDLQVYLEDSILRRCYDYFAEHTYGGIDYSFLENTAWERMSGNPYYWNCTQATEQYLLNHDIELAGELKQEYIDRAYEMMIKSGRLHGIEYPEDMTDLSGCLADLYELYPNYRNANFFTININYMKTYSTINSCYLCINGFRIAENYYYGKNISGTRFLIDGIDPDMDPSLYHESDFSYTIANSTSRPGTPLFSYKYDMQTGVGVVKDDGTVFYDYLYGIINPHVETRAQASGVDSFNLCWNTIGGDGLLIQFDDEFKDKGYILNPKFDENVDPTTADNTKPNRKTNFQDQYAYWYGGKKRVNQPNKEGEPEIHTYIPTPVPMTVPDPAQVLEEGVGVQENPNSIPVEVPAAMPNALPNPVPETAPANNVQQTQDNAIDSYNNSRTTPDSAPDPLPDYAPNPQYPDNPPNQPEGSSDTAPVPADIPGVEASGLVSVYNPTKAQLVSFSGWLWSNNFLDNFLKIFQNPMDAIIGLHVIYATPTSGSTSNIIAGYLDSGVSSKVVTKQYSEIDCGSVDVPEYFGNALDYEPYVQIHCYLPFVGIVSLKPNDILGKKLNIKYGVDFLTGACLAMLTTSKGPQNGGSKIMTYTFAGNCATQVPISGGSYAQMITGLAGVAVSAVAGAASGNPIALLGAGASVLNTHLDVQHSGSIGANAGAMGPRKPFLIITRKSAYEAAGYNQFYGYPANMSVVLGSCKGYTRVKSVHIESIPIATSDEKQEIETLLKQGVIIR